MREKWELMAIERGDGPAESTRVKARGGQFCTRAREAGGERERRGSFDISITNAQQQMA